MSGLDFTFSVTVCHGGLLGLLLAGAVLSLFQFIRNLLRRLSSGGSTIEGYRVLISLAMIAASAVLVWIRVEIVQTPEFDFGYLNHLEFVISAGLTAIFFFTRHFFPNGRLPVIVFGVLTVACLVMHEWYIEAAYIEAAKQMTLLPTKQSLNSVPVPSDSKLIFRRYSGCLPGLNAEAVALYASDSSPQEVCQFLRNHLQQSGWHVYGARSDCTPDTSRRYPGFGFLARWPFPPGDRQWKSYHIVTVESASASDMGLRKYEVEKYLLKAKSMARTIFTIHVTYYYDKDAYERKNPDNSFGECDQSQNRWEVTEE